MIAGESADLDKLAAELDGLSQQARRAPEHRGRVSHLLDGDGCAGISEGARSNRVRERQTDALSNYTGKLHENSPRAIRSRLFFQLFNPVRWVDCMNAAIDAGVDTIIEFGGGIGKGDGPDGKRPNLESIVKKSLKAREHQAQYLPAINAASLGATAQQF